MRIELGREQLCSDFLKGRITTNIYINLRANVTFKSGELVLNFSICQSLVRFHPTVSSESQIFSDLN